MRAAPRKLSPQKLAEIEAQSAAFAARANLGGGAETALASAGEDLMNADVVCVDEDWVLVPAELPRDVAEADVVKTLVEPRVRYDFAVTVTRLQLDVEKKIVVTKDGERRVFSGSVHEHGPKGFAVTWQALATLAVMVGQFAMPLNRLGTMLSTATKKFTSTSLARMAHYVAERLLPIYLVLMEQLADSDIMSGDDTSSRVLEVSTHYARAREGRQASDERPPWRDYGTPSEANETYLDYCRRKAALLAARAEGDREAKKTAVQEPPLKVLIGRELAFESSRKSGDGPKQSLNTTVVTGRTDADDPSSLVVFYRSHLGSLGNLLEMLLARRRPDRRKLIIQADLSTTNLVTDPALTSRFDIELVGCAAHARRPFAQYEDQDPKYAPMVLALFGMLAIHEEALDRHGRNRENTLAVRGVDSRPMWERLKAACTVLAQRWTKATPLGVAARYIIKHYDRLTAYLRDPRLPATNNLRERLLRTEKLIEKSSMFRQSIEGRAVLDILRTILQTAVAAGAGPHEYLVDVLKAAPEDIEAHPEHYTPAAWAKRRRQARDETLAANPAA
ncbi:MAG: transposase [Polyangiaceae bacterium]|nr:transposase [Polyangiaceae bacterium]